MKFILSFLLVFLCVFAKAQVPPPMKTGGPQGIEVNRLLSKDWHGVPIYIDTPANALKGGGWPGSGYIIQATKNYQSATIEDWLEWVEGSEPVQLDSVRWQDNQGTIYYLPKGIANDQVLDYILFGDTSLWHYTGRNWRRVGGNAEFYFDYLIDGGFVTQVQPFSSREFIISPADYYLRGLKYKYDTAFKIKVPSKAADSTGRIDVMYLSTTGPKLVKGKESRTPVKPQIRSGEIELASIYFRPFDTIPNIINGSAKGVSSIYRIPGRDSIYYTVDTLTFAIKDSLGITKNDTAFMLNAYKFTAANGLTKDSTVFRLGGSLNQNTNINLNTRRLTFIGGSDTTRFFSNGRVSIGGTPDSTFNFRVNGTTRLNGNTTYNGNLLPVGPGLYAAGFLAYPGAVGSRLQTYTNGGLSPLQYFNFDYFKTDLVRNEIAFDSIAFGYNFYNLALNGITTSQKGGGNTFNSLLINPTVRIGPTTTQLSYFRGVSFSPVLDSFNNVRFIPFTNTVGSNMFNTTWGNTRIGYPLSTLTGQNTTAYDTTYKLDVNGTGRFRNYLYLDSGRIIYGPSSSDAPLRIIKNWGGGTSPGILIGGANTIPSTSSALDGQYIIGDRNTVSGNSIRNTIIGQQNSISTNTSDSYIFGYGNQVTGENNHIILGELNTVNSYTNNGQNASITIGFGNNTNGFRGSGLIGNNLKYYANGQLAFGNGAKQSVDFTLRDVYFGNGVKNEGNDIHSNFGNGPDVTINPSWANDADSCLTCIPQASNANRNGGSLTITGGRGTGTGTPGTVRFSTWNATTSGSTLHPTLTERARISPEGSLLINRQSQPLPADTVFKLDVNGQGRFTNRLTVTDAGASIKSSSTQHFEVLDQFGTRNFMTGGEQSGGILIGNTGLGSGSGRWVSMVQSNQDSAFGGMRFYDNNNPTGMGVSGTIGYFGIRHSVTAPKSRFEVALSPTDVLNQDAFIATPKTLWLGYKIFDTIPSAALAVNSITQGFLQPRMSNTQRNAIPSTLQGLQVFSTTDSANYVYRGTGGGWQKIANEISGSAELDFLSTNGNTKSDLTITVTGAAEGDVVSLGIPNSVNLNHSCFTAWVSNANEVTVRFNNYGTGALDPVSATFKVKVFK